MRKATGTCPPICMMAWRIGDILDIQKQFDWIQAAGFDGVGFHADSGIPGEWRGVNPATCGPAERRRLRERLQAFSAVEIHAPFSLTLSAYALMPIVDGLEPVIAFAGDIGADVVTVHADPPALAHADVSWFRTLERLDGLAERNRLRIGLETTANFATIRHQALPCVGVTLDVGHMYCRNRRPLAPFGSIAAVVEAVGPSLIHLHLHDVKDECDHLEIGIGEVDYAGLIGALQWTRYSGPLCLELNPNRASPEAMQRSLQKIRTIWNEATQPPRSTTGF